MLSTEQQIFEQIKKANKILITFSKDRNGDAIASALALFLFLQKLNKQVDVVADKTSAEHVILNSQDNVFSFLPEFAKINNKLENIRRFIISLDITNAKVNQIKYQLTDNSLDFIISPKEGFFTDKDISTKPSAFKYDLIITLDTPDLESLGQVYDSETEFFYKTPIVNIDHHPANEEYGQINFVEINAVSTSEILFSLFDSYDRKLVNADIATCLLAGIIYKTKNFKTQAITPQTLLITSKLISLEARREDIINYLYRSRDIRMLKLWGRVLANLNGELDDKIVWSNLTKQDFSDTESSEGDLSDVIDELIINIPKAKIIVLFYEKNDSTEVIVYSKSTINSLDLIKTYNPIGTKGLAQVTLNKPIKEVEKEIIEVIKNKLSQLPL